MGQGHPKKVKETGPLINILFNIALPVFLLNKLSKMFGENGPLIGLLVALSLPLCLGAYDYFRVKKKNFIAILGIVNILLTGGLALIHLEGHWFAVKEAAFPLVIGLGVLGSMYSKRSLFEVLIFNENIMETELVHQKLAEYGNETKFKKHLKLSTLYFSLSFFLSSVLNYVLAVRIFLPIDPALSAHERSIILNEQIAEMTWQSYLVILVPSFIFMGFILWHLTSGIKKYTHLTLEEVIKNH